MKKKIIRITALCMITTFVCAGIIIHAINNNQDVEHRAVLVMAYEK